MKYLRFKIPIYSWEVIFIEAEAPRDIDDIQKILSRVNPPMNILERINDNVYTNGYDGGEIMTNFSKALSIIFLYRQLNQKHRINTLFHEIYHLINHITNTTHIEGSESIAYLQGYIAEKFYPIIYENE